MAKKRRYFNGLTELMVLACLTKKTCYGYEIADAININFDNKYKVNQNTIYTVLYSLRDRKLIEEYNITVGRKRERVYYTILPEGVKCFEKYLMEYRDCTESVENVLLNVMSYKFIKMLANISI